MKATTTEPATIRISALQLVTLASKINTAHKAALAGYRKSLTAALEAGGLLAEAKAEMKHGEWERWLAKNCPNLPERTASQYMLLHRYRDEIQAANKSADSADFNITAALGFIRAIMTRSDKKPSEKSAKASPKTSGPDIEARLASFQQTFAWQEIPPGVEDKTTVADKVRALIRQLEEYLGRLAV